MTYRNLHHIETISGSISGDRLQYLIFTCLSLGVLGAVGILYFSDKPLFQRFLGGLNPLLVFLIAIIFGVVLLSFLLSQKWFAICGKESLNGLLRFSGLAALLGIIMILVDTRIIFAADVNISFPESLLFYPVMGFLVEILFHVLPLAILLVTLKLILKETNVETLALICIPIVALLEPVYQSLDMVSAKRFPLWGVLCVGGLIFLINLFQLLIFKRYDFMAMYSFRLVYYAIWHVGWGYVRLGYLF